MKLTEYNRRHIDAMCYYRLLYCWRFAAPGDHWMEGETGAYWQQRMRELREQPGGEELHAETSRAIGWDR